MDNRWRLTFDELKILLDYHQRRFEELNEQCDRICKRYKSKVAPLWLRDLRETHGQRLALIKRWLLLKTRN